MNPSEDFETRVATVLGSMLLQGLKSDMTIERMNARIEELTAERPPEPDVTE